MKNILILLLTLVLVSCNKFLDDPGDPTKRVPSTILDAQMLMDQPIRMGTNHIGTDEYFLPLSRYNRSNERTKNFYLTWVTNYNSQPLAKEYWSEPYRAIFNANLCLEILDEISVSDVNRKEWNNVKGIAYFKRAFALFSIASQFCKAYNDATAETDLGAVVDLQSEASNKLSRSSVAATYQQIISDGEEAIKYLPLHADHPLRPSQVAAYGLLARVYLSMRQYDRALEQCDKYLKERNALMNFNDPAEINANEPYPLSRQLYGKEVAFYVHGFSITTQPGFLNNNYVDTVLYAGFDENDLRKTIYFSPSQGYHLFRGSYAILEIMTGICTDEIYITRAECLARMGSIGAAMDDLNTLLVTRWKTGFFTPFTASTEEEALAIILQERKKELLFRGLRWMDIKRLNEEGANISLTRKMEDKTVVLAPRDPRFAMQLPADLVFNFGYEQNPIE